MVNNVNFVVSDTDEQNFPVDMEDLQKRLESIKNGIPQQGDNINPFVIPAFTLFKDCGLINKEVVENLNDAEWCNSNISLGNFAPPTRMNPLGGVLRREDLPMFGISKNGKGQLRYYCPHNELKDSADISFAKNAGFKGDCKCAVICEGITYYISNDWFTEGQPRPTKKNFYAWLVMMTVVNCPNYWDEQKKKEKPSDENLISVPANDFKSMLNLMKSLHNKVDNLTAQIEEIKNMWK